MWLGSQKSSLIHPKSLPNKSQIDLKSKDFDQNLHFDGKILRVLRQKIVGVFYKMCYNEKMNIGNEIFYK